MIRKHHIARVNFPGGIIPVGELSQLVKVASQAGARELAFGSRQQAFIEVPRENAAAFDEAPGTNFVDLDTDPYPNIVSSCVAEQVTQGGTWVKEGVYKDVLSAFEDYRPGVSVNVVDPTQNLVPFATGQLNFIASGIGNFWHLLWRPSGRLVEWKSLVYSAHIPGLTRRLEAYLMSGRPFDPDRVYAEVMQEEQWVEQPVRERIVFPDFALPYYEGFNRYNERLWLGIYRRDELFPLAFLEDLCVLCRQTKVAQVYTTSWKSLVIRGIDPAERKGWDIILGRHGINVRHSLCELSWRVEDLSPEALGLKRYLVNALDRDDVRTFGLCFGVQMAEGPDLGAIVLIRKNPSRRTPARYDILYKRDFSQSAEDHVVFRTDVEKAHLSSYLRSLCKYFYECKAGEEQILHHVYRQKGPKAASADPGPGPEAGMYQCGRCLTIYDPALGEPEAGVPVGSSFEVLDAYECPLCGSDKSAFGPLQTTKHGDIFRV